MLKLYFLVNPDNELNQNHNNTTLPPGTNNGDESSHINIVQKRL